MQGSEGVSEVYGQGDATFKAAGGEEGVRALVDAFYDLMESDTRYLPIWRLHRSDKHTMRDKLARFLCGWMGGPRLYQDKFGPISIPGTHAHLHVGIAERDLWLDCMNRAAMTRGYPARFQDYLMSALAVPAERIRQVNSVG